MNVVSIASEIWIELGEPTDINLAGISFWIRNNIGKINNLLHTEFSIDSTTLEFSPDLGDDEKVIFTKLYTIYYYDKLIRTNLGASAFETVLSVDSDGASVRRINKTEIAKTYQQSKKAETEELKDLIAGYRTAKAVPLQITGDDHIEGSNNLVDGFVRTTNPF